MFSDLRQKNVRRGKAPNDRKAQSVGFRNSLLSNFIFCGGVVSCGASKQYSHVTSTCSLFDRRNRLNNYGSCLGRQLKIKERPSESCFENSSCNESTFQLRSQILEKSRFGNLITSGVKNKHPFSSRIVEHCIVRGGAAEISTTNDKNTRIAVTSGRPPVLGASSFKFLSKDDISKLSLEDLTMVICYALESNREGFDREVFLKESSEISKMAIGAIEEALLASRGPGILPATTSKFSRIIDDISWLKKNKRMQLEAEASVSEVGCGDIDALQFCAAMRIFAEWRIAKLALPCYKSYTAGMRLGFKDVVKNVAKIEAATFAWLQREREKAITKEISTVRSPTLRQLLEDEFDHKFHPKLPVLKDPSGAMGLLWVHRQLCYQSISFYNVIIGAPDAVKSAYKDVFDCCHGWAAQKMFQMSFKSAPDVKEIYRQMNNPNTIVSKSKSNPGSSEEMAVDLLVNDPSDNKENIVTDLDPKEVELVRRLNKEGNEQYDTEFALKEVATKQMKLFLKSSVSLLCDCQGLLDEFDMDDPTKV